MVTWYSKMMGWLLANVSNKDLQEDIHFNLAYFVHVWKIPNIISHKKLLKLNFLYFSSSHLVESTEKCSTILIWRPHKETTSGVQTCHCDAMFSRKILHGVFPLFRFSLATLSIVLKHFTSAYSEGNGYHLNPF